MQRRACKPLKAGDWKYCNGQERMVVYGILEPAGGGHLDVLQWARSQDCPWDEETCIEATKNDHFEIFQWARANGCPCNFDWSIGRYYL